MDHRVPHFKKLPPLSARSIVPLNDNKMSSKIMTSTLSKKSDFFGDMTDNTAMYRANRLTTEGSAINGIESQRELTQDYRKILTELNKD